MSECSVLQSRVFFSRFSDRTSLEAPRAAAKGAAPVEDVVQVAVEVPSARRQQASALVALGIVAVVVC